LHNPFFFYHGSANSTATEALDMAALDRQFTFSYQLMLIAFGLFFIGQTFFVVDFLKRIKKGRRRTYRNSVAQEY
jgi:cbb3-type cytochrome oxidase subunit 3